MGVAQKRACVVKLCGERADWSKDSKGLERSLSGILCVRHSMT